MSQIIEGLEYLLVEPAYEVNEKGTREKNEGNENMSMDDIEKIEVGSDEGSFVEEDWNKPEQNEVPKWTELDLPITTETRRGGRKKTSTARRARCRNGEHERPSGRLRVADHQGQCALVTGRLHRTQKRSRSRTKRDRKKREYQLEDSRLNA